MQLKDFPEGKLICTSYKTYYKWYQNDGSKTSYIPKKNYLLAKQLAAKKYILLQMEHLIHQVPGSHFVRSKSETIIAMMLKTNKIPYRYECKLRLDGRDYYPDFTIRHPITGEVFYWEHHGLMDDEDYCQKAASKLQVYCRNNIIPTVNLILTYETKEKPLDSELVENYIKYYFL